MRFTRFIASLVFIFCYITLSAQDPRIESIKNNLTSLAVELPGLNDGVELTINEIPLYQFLRTLGVNHSLNINVDSDLTQTLTTNFADAKVSDVLVFLAREYDLKFEFNGTIISISKYEKPVDLGVDDTRVKVNYLINSDTLILDLKNDTLSYVVEEITRASGVNVILSPEVEDQKVTAFLSSTLDKALNKLAFILGLSLREDDGFYVLYLPKTKDVPKEKESNGKITLNGLGEGIRFELENDLITVAGVEVKIPELIEFVADQTGDQYVMYDRPAGVTNLYLSNVNFDQFLNYILNGTGCTFRLIDDTYLIGKADKQLLQKSRLVRFNNRVIEDIIATLPEELTAGIVLKEFTDLNAIVVSGDHSNVDRLESFLRKMDQPVPVVLIEVLIVDYNKSRTVSGGISAGVGAPPGETGGTITPGADFNPSTLSINNLINSFNGFGLINLGNVSNDFYVNIQALEEDGILKTRSTPKLSTLNGHEATLSIGNTEYYLEQTSQIIGSQNPTVQTQQVYKSVTADLNITITPIVTGNDEVTLTIRVQQSDFTARISDLAPPGNVSRNFESKVRIQNGDMILLGGLESNTTNKSGRGLPFLARVPGIKWLFGRRTNNKAESKLNVFIKSTVLR